MNLKKYFVAGLLFTIVFQCYDPCAFGRWSEPEEATSEVTFSRVHLDIQKDGSYVLEREREVLIKKDKARTEEGLFRTTFTPGFENFELIRAETRNLTGAKVVDRKDVEIKPLASSGQGFDSTSQVTIAFPDVGIGSKLYIHYRLNIKKAVYPGAFFMTVPLGWRENLKSFSLEVTSKIPIYHELLDDGKHLKFEGSNRNFKVVLEKPLYKLSLEEENSLINARSLVWIGLTSLKGWEEFPKGTVAGYESVLSSKLPKKFEKILKSASAKKTAFDQINTVTSELAEEVRYVGDWRAVKGSYVPRELTKVASTGYGDCKDFSAVTGAILRQMGYETHVALVGRGVDLIVSPLSVAAPDINHAILFAVKDGREYWIDPTNLTSFAEGIFPDIADRPALVLSPQGSFSTRTPAMSPSKDKWLTKTNLNFNKNQAIEAKGLVQLTGRGALGLAGSDLFNSKNETDHAIIAWASNPANLKSWKVGPHNLTSRVVGDVQSDFEYVENWRPAMSTAGTGYLAPAIAWLGYFRFNRTERATDLNLGFPLFVVREYKISGKEIILPKEIHCAGQSPWADYSREVRMQEKTLRITESIDFKLKIVPAKDIASDKFADFQEGILRCMQDMVIVFK